MLWPLEAVSEGFDRLGRQRRGFHTWETNDHRVASGQVNSTAPAVPFEMISTGGTAPAAAEQIEVKIVPLGESLVLINKHGEIHKPSLGNPQTNPFDYLGPRFLRRATLKDVQKWRKFIADIQAHPST